jgi:hypothetical protein
MIDESPKPRQPSILSRLSNSIRAFRQGCHCNRTFSDRCKLQTRRIYRLAVFWLIIVLITLSVAVMVEETKVHEEFTFSGSSLSLEVSA